jgi:hypothetical protein
MTNLGLLPAVAAAAAVCALTCASAGAAGYAQTNLVSDLPGATLVDASLVDPWGLATSPTSPFWVSDNGSGVVTLYSVYPVTNVAPSDGGTGGTGSVRIGLLVGDVNATRAVSIADPGLVNAQLAQPVSAVNYLKDVNVSGTLTLADKAITNANLTKALPAP